MEAKPRTDGLHEIELELKWTDEASKVGVIIIFIVSEDVLP